MGLPHGLGSAVWIIGEAIGVLNVVGVLDGVLNIGSLFDVFCSRAREGYSQKKFKTETPILICNGICNETISTTDPRYWLVLIKLPFSRQS